ncbi:MAG: DUF4152 family protein [Candidatus Poribacteria bacterium]|nr:DUF4152 family protein [Candidatus Poribacteria bacterium]
MRIATVDSGCSILDRDFKPISILSTVALVVDQPYQAPMQLKARSGDYAMTDPNVLIYELQLCYELLENQEADCVHLDLTLGGVNILDLTDEYLFQMQLSQMGRSVLHAIMPALRKIAMEINDVYHIPVLALGKQSVPVRLAELYAAAYGMQHACEKAQAADAPIYVGLPAKVSACFENGVVHVSSAEPMEDALTAEVPVENGILVEQFLNPVTRGFQVLKIGN